MKTYNIVPETINIADQNISVITLGEAGRGRIQKHIPCAEGTLLECPNVNPNLKIKPKAKILASTSEKGWLARISTEGTYVRGANGNISISPEYVENIRVVAFGQGAFGAAGRTGTWDDILIATELEEFWLRVKPSRGDAYILLFKEGKVSRINYAQAELLDIDFLGSNSNSRGDLVKLGE